MVVEFRLGDLVRLRKPHPCGADQWRVIRLGADIGLRCTGCQRRVLLDRVVLERRLRAFVERGPEVVTGHWPPANADSPSGGGVS